MGKRRDIYEIGRDYRPDSTVVCNGVDYPWPEWAALTKERRQELIHRPSVGLPTHYRTARFPDFPDTFCKTVYDLQLWTQDKERTAGLYVHGPTGVGKTHLMAATMAELRMQGGDHRWLTEDGFFEELWTRQQERGERAYYRELLAPDVLVLDDLFSALRWNDWKREQLDRLIRTVYDSTTVLAVTSNVPPGEVGPLGVLSERARSRMREMFYPVAVKGPDRRSKPRPPIQREK